MAVQYGRVPGVLHATLGAARSLVVPAGAGQREIDAVVEVAGRVHAFEVKHGANPGSRDARHLDWLRDDLGDRFASGHVLHTGGDAYPLGDRIWAVPIVRLWV